jgi:hypothetical protein
MKRIMLLVTVVLVMAAMMVVLAGTAMAHTEGDPCAAAGEDPGNSGYADHHVLPLVGGQGGPSTTLASTKDSLRACREARVAHSS